MRQDLYPAPFDGHIEAFSFHIPGKRSKRNAWRKKIMSATGQAAADWKRKSKRKYAWQVTEFSAKILKYTSQRCRCETRYESVWNVRGHLPADLRDNLGRFSSSAIYGVPAILYAINFYRRQFYAVCYDIVIRQTEQMRLLWYFKKVCIFFSSFFFFFFCDWFLKFCRPLEHIYTRSKRLTNSS